MIADPCNSTLLPGIYGSQSGLLARVKSTATLETPQGDLATCGYCLWCPDFHAKHAGSIAAPEGITNMWTLVTVDPDSNPSNTTANPYGHAPAFTTANTLAGSLNDPAGGLMEDDIVQDARTIGACMQMVYTGKMQDASGQICVIESLPLSTLLTEGAGAYTLSVNDVFRVSTKTRRLGIDSHEVVARPTELSEVFRTGDEGALIVGDGASKQTLYSETAKAQQPTVFGFAWRGLNTAQVNPFQFTFIKSLEWRPAPISGLVHAPPRQINKVSVVPRSLAYLDQHHNGWQDRLIDGLASTASTIAQAAFTGVASRGIGAMESIATSSVPFLEDVGLGMLALV